MGHKNKPRILDDDIELMIRIARHGFVDMDYIQLFAYEGRKKRDDRQTYPTTGSARLLDHREDIHTCEPYSKFPDRIQDRYFRETRSPVHGRYGI